MERDLLFVRNFVKQTTPIVEKVKGK